MVQETFLRAFKRLEGFKFNSAFSTWLQSIAANCSFTLVEQRSRLQKGRVEPRDDEDDKPMEFPSGSPSPEQLVLSGEIRGKVSQALETLTSAERTAFVMRHFEGNSIEEISIVLGIATTSAKNCVYRAVQKMRFALEPLARPAR